MRTSRATNCAIAPGAGSRLPAAASPLKILLAGRARQVNVACERGVIEGLEDRILIVDLNPPPPRPPHPRRAHVELMIVGFLHPQPRPRDPLGTAPPQPLLDARLTTQ